MSLTDEAELKEGLEELISDSDEEYIGIEDVSERNNGIRWKVINLHRIENPLWHIPRYYRSLY